MQKYIIVVGRWPKSLLCVSEIAPAIARSTQPAAEGVAIGLGYILNNRHTVGEPGEVPDHGAS